MWPDGTRMQTTVTGSNHGDLRIIQTDLTHYAAVSPYENPSSFRPILQEDTRGLALGDSTEPAFFSIILKYAEQIGKKDELAEILHANLMENS